MTTFTSSRCLKRARTALFALAMICVSVASSAAVFVSVAIAPPPLPVYAQPICPGPGYIWEPGYWAYGPAGYYWVPGEWVLAPFVGALWTPGYWGWGSGLYVWHAGYWGTRVGFYGGINYGFGYTGYGYHGGYWRGNTFYYNRAANNVNINAVHTTYRTAINNVTASRVSYNGGRGGIAARANATQLAYARQPHTAMTATQVGREQAVAPERNTPVHVGRMQAAPRSAQNHVAAMQTAPPRQMPAHASPPRASASASVTPMRSRVEPSRVEPSHVEPSHTEARMHANAARVQAQPRGPEERPRG